ncbi:uncharacterized protein B0H18DRAFT_860296, partial [Fomitopsis serialis]|uniref:uncharacterized protein n=1 Tax=Fomitopsis serialis TaxID=139415 RepID=UPI00200873A3
SLVRYCAALECKGAAHDFISMITLIQLVYKCASISDPGKVNIAKIWRVHVSHIMNPPSKRTFQAWHALGTRFAKVAEGGTVYALMLIAIKGLRVRLAEAEGSIGEEMGNILRRPNTNTQVGRVVRNTLIPLVALLRVECPLYLSALFDRDTVVLQGLTLDSICGDLDSSDRLFKVIASNSFALLPRDTIAWASCTGIIEISPSSLTFNAGPSDQRSQETCVTVDQRELSPLTPLSSDLELESFDLDQDAFEPDHTSIPPTSTNCTPVITTTYDVFHERNQRFTASRDRQENTVWTERRRDLAGRASVPTTRQALELELQSMYSDGTRSNGKHYVKIEQNIFEDGLIIEDVNSNTIVGICASMPNNMRENLTDHLTSCFPFDPLKAIRTASTAGDITFEVLHFSWYNRHCTQGNSAPTDVPPFMLGRPNGLRINYAQMLPYMSKDMTQHEDIYHSLRNVLGDVFEWLDYKLGMMFPNFYTTLEKFVEILPGNNMPLSAPFLGLVVNLNVVTQAH